MFEEKDVTVILSQAGAGKTHKLKTLVIQELQTRRPEEIAYVTFTRKGAEEGLKRICDTFMLSKKDLPYVRTLHSLTFRALNLKANQMFNLFHERRFNKLYGYSLNRCLASNGNVHPTKDSKYLDYYDLERSQALTSTMLKESDIDKVYYRRLIQKYEEYKNQQRLVDFFDCLLKFVSAGVPLPVKVVMIDETQDISLLQWKVIEVFTRNAETIYIAGDENQSIYTYSGARPDFLIDLAKQYKVEYLSTSYRIPKKIFDLSKGIIGFITQKTDKPFEFKEGNPEGSITQLSSPERLNHFIKCPEKNKPVTDWYLLARNKCFFSKYQQVLEDNLIPYWTADGFFMGGEIMSRLKDYEGFKLQGYKTEKKREQFLKKFGLFDFNSPFVETNIFTDDRKWIYYAYIEKFGLPLLKEMCEWEPQILLSTIHFVKGGEADNVAILLDNTKKTNGTIFRDIDEELRVLYVGVTRTKKNLYLIDSEEQNGFDAIVRAIKNHYDLVW